MSDPRVSRLLWIVAIVLILLWLLGLVSDFTMHGFIHVLLILALVAVLIRVIQGRWPLG